MTTVGEAIVKVTTDTSAAASDLNNFGAKIDQSLSRNLSNAGRSLSTFVTAPLVGLAAVGVKTASDFEKSMNTIAAVAGVPGPELEKLRQLAIKLGADTVFSANEAAEGQLQLAKAGISTADILGGALASALSLATAGDLELADASTVLSNAMNTFNIAGKDSARVADALAGAANASSADVSDLALALSQVGLVANSSGLTLEETTAALAALADAGIKGSDAGTSLKTMLMNLQPVTKRQVETMNDLGISFVNADGSFKSITEIAGILQDKLGGLSEAERAMALEMMFGSDAIRAGTALMEQGSKGLEEYISKTSEAGAAAKVAEGKMKGLPGAIERFRGSIETMLLSVGNALAPFVSAAADFLGGLADAFSSLPGPIQTLLVAFGGLAATIGPVLFVIGSLMSAVAPGGVLAVGFAALTGPVGIAIAAFVALGLALMALWRNSETFRNAVTAVFETVKAAFTAFVNAFQGWEPETGGIIGAFAQIGNVAGVMFDNIQIALAAFKGWWDEIWPQFSEAVGHVLNLIQISLEGWIAFITAIWKLWGDDLLTILRGVWDVIFGVVKGALQVVQGIIQTVLAVINGDWGKAWDGIKKIFEGVMSALEGIGRGAMTALRGAIGAGWDAIQTFAGSWAGKLVGAIGNPGALLMSVGRAIMEGLLGGIRDKWEAIASYLSGLARKIKDLKGPIEKDRKMLIPEGQAIMDSLMAGFASRQGALAQTLGAVSKQIQNGGGLGNLNVTGTATNQRALTPVTQTAAPVYEVSVTLPDRAMKLSLDSADPMSLKRFIEQLAELLVARELSFG
jgi:TP901 family phage tail tape measure protein